ncbi:hypothetical protein EV188_1119 [Actinomycetospora succinea]|uniref:Uncharacterized protein n=1 Tax=Actinomycetospora succinea TaxID=663603 RepID=A0A4R6USQ1_9PSEU|nr:DUF6308 family protein [Actinomycetospora succinea]TDQ48839.1 hypothetical protein EV188_1119 [Actinomycetospora succinea]
MGATPEWLIKVAKGSEEHRDWCTRALTTYFDEPAPGRPNFSGASFDVLGENPPDRIVPDDLVAVSLLSVRVPKHAALRVLGPDADRISGLLEGIPADRDLHDATPGAIADGECADQLWWVLAERRPGRPRADVDGFGDVTISKILARKRPRLLPVWDSVVGKQLGLRRPRDHWTCVQELLHRDPAYVEVLRAAHQAAGLSDRVSVLRTLDVLLWMDGTGHCPAP